MSTTLIPEATTLRLCGNSRETIKRKVDALFAGYKPTPRAGKVLELAFSQAIGLKHCSVGSEDLLAGLIKEGSGLAFSVLKFFGLSLQRVYGELLPEGADIDPEELFYHADVIKLIVQAKQEADKLNHNYIGTEHLLLALIATRTTLGCQIVETLGIPLESLRGEILDLLVKSEELEIPAQRFNGSSALNTISTLTGLKPEEIEKIVVVKKRDLPST